MGFLRRLGITAGIVLVLIMAVLAPFPLPPDRVLSQEWSPDGRFVALFSWRPAGIVSVITRDNPWVYVTVREKGSNAVVERHSTWGDVPEDAYSRLGQHVRWGQVTVSSRTSG